MSAVETRSLLLEMALEPKFTTGERAIVKAAAKEIKALKDRLSSDLCDMPEATSNRKVEVGFYGKPADVGGYVGWTATDKWILWEHLDGSLHVYARGEGGKVTGESAILNGVDTENSVYNCPPIATREGKQ